MNKTQEVRRERLMPNGIPRWIRAYDNGGVDAENGSSDRYTVLFTHMSLQYERERWYQYVVMSGCPYHPQGIGIHGEHTEILDSWKIKDGKKTYRCPPSIGRKCHLGIRVSFNSLPEDCKEIVIRDYMELWDIK